MSLTLLTAIVVALAVGLLIGWVAASFRANRLQSESAALSVQVAELRRQLETSGAETGRLRKEVQEEKTLRARAEANLQNERANLAAQKSLLDEAESKLREAFGAVAGEALQKSTEQFLQLAKESFARLQTEASGELSQKQETIRGHVDGLQQSLFGLETQLRQLEANRESAYGELRNQVQQLAATNRDLQKETGTLVSTLRQPQVKGRWGELTLRRTIELAGMSPHCDFVEQISAEAGEGHRLRADVVVHLPGGANVVVDAKVPLHGFMKVYESQTDAEREAGLVEHARLVRGHVNQLSCKEYWKQFRPCPEFVVLFVPGESFFSAALERDKSLLEDALASHVVLASPANLIAILRAVAYGWRQEQVAENAQQISDLGGELFYRVLKFLEHMDEVRAGLERTNKAFNGAAGSLEGRILPAARRLKEIGGYNGDLPAVEPTETALRVFNPVLSAEVK